MKRAFLIAISLAAAACMGAADAGAPGSDSQKIADFYESFMNGARAEELGLTPLKAELVPAARSESKVW